MGKRINLFSKISIDLEYVHTEAATGPFFIKSKTDPGRIRMFEVAGSSFRVILCIGYIVVWFSLDETRMSCQAVHNDLFLSGKLTIS